MTLIAPAATPRKRRTGPSARHASQVEMRYAVPALEKGLDILELLAREAEGLSLNELARELGRTSSELFRMVVALTDTASGYVLLAFQDDATRRAMLASHQEVEGELDLDRAQLEKIVRDVAKKGYAEVQSRQTRGVTNIAFPIRGPDGRAMAV